MISKDAIRNPLFENYCRPAVVALRTAPNALVCADDDCELSGFFAHVGPCEPCACSLNYAIAECRALGKDCPRSAQLHGAAPGKATNE